MTFILRLTVTTIPPVIVVQSFRFRWRGKLSRWCSRSDQTRSSIPEARVSVDGSVSVKRVA
ncbi:MAG: hypothetical protein MUC83_08285, partial [Pirellula sp.]|nr:hypothetical protein [Pirellula sp.]